MGARGPANMYTLPAGCILGCFKSPENTGGWLIRRVNGVLHGSVGSLVPRLQGLSDRRRAPLTAASSGWKPNLDGLRGTAMCVCVCVGGSDSE